MAYVNLLDIIYPINSIYMTNNPNETPASRVGGTWVEIGSGKYLMAAAGYYLAGTEGGNNTITLSVANLPVHNHVKALKLCSSEASGFGLTSSNYFCNNVAIKGGAGDLTGNTGSGTAHSNMPEYHGVRIFYRTA